MKIFDEDILNISNAVIILGFFDGIHLGHRAVIEQAVDYAKRNNAKTLLLTFSASPAEFFNNSYDYIYSRDLNYRLIEELGVDYIISKDFSKLVNIKADEYLKQITDNYVPIAIFSGFNYTFGANKIGNADYLKMNEALYNYKYFDLNPISLGGEIVSSTLIKETLKAGNIQKANLMLGKEFFIESSVVEGQRIGRKLGYPTANMEYPKDIVKIPYGVYKVRALGLPAVLNWGVKPTLGNNKELLEVHIPNFNENLYGKDLKIEIIDKIRDEKKFDNFEALKSQIEKDVEECLKLS